ncbi:hypothetical protein AVEN_35296-1 [Araneus ventricosus]|uniref:Uncharacterized protein n=1 Tax=Araneus ventricosus TaxID=182803 RepID=A0A4Y2Q2P7_ARAVE|nr:hypothetical protein AVEN_35296-1 [Araneus ventricosus]
MPAYLVGLLQQLWLFQFGFDQLGLIEANRGADFTLVLQIGFLRKSSLQFRTSCPPPQVLKAVVLFHGFAPACLIEVNECDLFSLSSARVLRKSARSPELSAATTAGLRSFVLFCRFCISLFDRS